MNSTHKFLTLMVGVTLVLGALLLQSGCCKEDPPPPPPPIEEDKPPVEEEKDPLLEITFPKDTIPYGDKDIEISWENQNVTRLFINDEEQFYPRFGSVKISDRLFSDSTLIFKGVNKKKEVVEEVTIKVGDWYESIFGLVSYYPWKEEKFTYTDLNDNLIASFPPLPGTEHRIFYFYKDGRCFFSHTPYRVVRWYIKDKNTLVIDGEEGRLRVSEERLIISARVKFKDQEVWANTHYVHASDTPLE